MTYDPDSYNSADPYGTDAAFRGPAGGYCHAGQTPPTSANIGDFWWRTTGDDPLATVGLYVYYQSVSSVQWVEMTNGSVSVAVSAALADLIARVEALEAI